MKLVIIVMAALVTLGCEPVTTITATCDNGFIQEAERLHIDKDTLVWRYPYTVYKIPDGVTCVVTHRRLDNEDNR